MEAWPIEEVWGRPALTVIVCAAVPWSLERGVARLLGRADSGDARAPLAAASLALAFALGVTALGPALVDARESAASHAFGAAMALLALAGLHAARTLPRPAAARGALALVGVVGLSQLARLASLPAWPFATGAVGLLGAALGVHARARGLDRLALGAGVAAAAMAASLIAIPWVTTDVAVDRAPTAGGDASRWRLRVDPWDEGAMLGAGWASRQRGEHARAIAQAREARRMGADAASTLELEAEVQAAAGDCEAARRTFDRALRARASQVFADSVLTAPLTLGGFRLPPALVTECGGLEQLPGAADLEAQRP